MFWKRRIRGRPFRPCALAGTLFAGLMSAGCFYIGEDESRAEAEIEEVRESMHEVADESADGLADAASQLAGLSHDIDLELSSETLVERPVSFRALRDVLPDEAGGFSLSSRERSTVAALGLRVSKVEAEYGNGDGADVDVTIADIGALPIVGSEDFLDWLDVEIDEESERGGSARWSTKGYPAWPSFGQSAEALAGGSSPGWWKAALWSPWTDTA